MYKMVVHARVNGIGFMVSTIKPGDHCELIEQAADRVDIRREIEVYRLIELYYYY